MQTKTTALSELSRAIGLQIHPDKSKVLKVKTAGSDQILVEGKPLDVVDSFTYLGSIVDAKGGTVSDIKARMGKARTAFSSLNKVWKDRNISTKTKVKLFNSNVKPVLLNGSETWSLTQSWTQKLQTFINTCLRRILRTRWTDKLQNTTLWERTGQKPITEEIGQRRWRWMGHTLRKQPSNITRHAYNGTRKDRGKGVDREQHGEDL